ncbi:MAG: hypothetical protein WEC75_00265 [Dehalococcoidia bacterium]
MTHKVRFALEVAPDREAVEADVALAIFTAECVYGRARARMEARYSVAADGRRCVIDVGGDAGEAAARVLAGLLAARVGEEGFSVRRD